MTYRYWSSGYRCIFRNILSYLILFANAYFEFCAKSQTTLSFNNLSYFNVYFVCFVAILDFINTFPAFRSRLLIIKYYFKFILRNTNNMVLIYTRIFRYLENSFIINFKFCHSNSLAETIFAISHDLFITYCISIGTSTLNFLYNP